MKLRGSTGKPPMSEISTNDDEDRIDCPFCAKMHYTGSGTAEATGWTWDSSIACEHLLFMTHESDFSGFYYRSRLFNEHLSLHDSDEAEVRMPSEHDPEEFLSIAEIIQKIRLPGLESRVFGDCRSDITFGFVPQIAN